MSKVCIPKIHFTSLSWNFSFTTEDTFLCGLCCTGVIFVWLPPHFKNLSRNQKVSYSEMLPSIRQLYFKQVLKYFFVENRTKIYYKLITIKIVKISYVQKFLVYYKFFTATFRLYITYFRGPIVFVIAVFYCKNSV